MDNVSSMGTSNGESLSEELRRKETEELEFDNKACMDHIEYMAALRNATIENYERAWITVRKKAREIEANLKDVVERHTIYRGQP